MCSQIADDKIDPVKRDVIVRMQIGRSDRIKRINKKSYFNDSKAIFTPALFSFLLVVGNKINSFLCLSDKIGNHLVECLLLVG